MMYNVLRVILEFVFHIIFSYKIYGRENIPLSGGAIVAPNHRSYWDVPFIGIVCRRPLRYMAKAELFENPVFGRLITALGAFPVKRGGGDTGAVKTAMDIVEDGGMLMMFPQGRRVKDGERGKAKPGAALVAAHTGASVIPVRIEGRYRFRGRIEIHVGEPIDFERYKDSRPENLQELADGILDRIYEM